MAWVSHDGSSRSLEEHFSSSQARCFRPFIAWKKPGGSVPSGAILKTTADYLMTSGESSIANPRQAVQTFRGQEFGGDCNLARDTLAIESFLPFIRRPFQPRNRHQH